MQRCLQGVAGVGGRCVEAAGRGERSSGLGGQERGGWAHAWGARGNRRVVGVRKETVVDVCVSASQQCDREAGAPRRVVVKS